MALKLTFKGGRNWRRVESSYFSMIMREDPFENCQVGTVGGIEEFLDIVKNRNDVIYVMKRFLFGKINMVVIDVEYSYSDRVEKHFNGAIAGSTLYTSTNGNLRVLYIVNVTKL